MLELTVRKLTERDFPAAWPLARTVAAAPDLTGWLVLARSAAASGGGVLGVEAEDGILHGMATYKPVEKSGVGRVLEVGAIAAFELSPRAPVRRFLDEALDSHASALGCEAGIVGPLKIASCIER